MIREPEEDAEVPQRSRPKWLVIGAALTVVVWVPLLVVAMPLGAALSAHLSGTSRDALIGSGGGGGAVPVILAAVPPLLTFVLASAASSAIVRRLGGHVRAVDPALAGLLGATLVVVTAWILGPSLPKAALLLSLVLLGIGGAAGGHAGGARWRGRR